MLAACLLGCLIFVVDARADDPLVATSRRVDVDYAVNDAALPLTAVELYYSADQGATWTLFGEDEDRQSPARFVAPDDGLFGLYLVLKNTSGASSSAPAPGAKPHLLVRVDETVPLVQLHPPRLSDAGDHRFVQIRWTAVDSQFGPRPIRLEYHPSDERDWAPVSEDPLANTGRFDWRVPDGLLGTVMIRATAQDLGGHTVSSEPQAVEVPPSRRPGDESPVSRGSQPDARGVLATASRDPASAAGRSGEPGTANGSRRTRERAQRLLTEAIVLGQRGELREAIVRAREAVRLDPESTEGFTEMGNLLLRAGDWDRSLSAYEIALRQKPAAREALLGAAKVHTQRKDYPAAAERLRTVLRYNPADAEVWMNLGDVAIYRGDEVAAREYYLRATQIDPAATRVIEDAKRRLQIMTDATKAAGPKSTPARKP